MKYYLQMNQHETWRIVETNFCVRLFRRNFSLNLINFASIELRVYWFGKIQILGYFTVEIRVLMGMSEIERYEPWWIFNLNSYVLIHVLWFLGLKKIKVFAVKDVIEFVMVCRCLFVAKNEELWWLIVKGLREIDVIGVEKRW